MCGGTTVDRGLHELLTKKYGQDFSGKPMKEISQGSKFMKEFENIKICFDGEPGDHTLPLRMNRETGDGYDADSGEITLTRQANFSPNLIRKMLTCGPKRGDH